MCTVMNPKVIVIAGKYMIENPITLTDSYEYIAVKRLLDKNRNDAMWINPNKPKKKEDTK